MKNFLGGNIEELLDTNGPPWEPKGVDAGGGYAPPARSAES